VAIDVVVPEVGEVGMEVTFVTWYHGEGDEVVAGEPLYQVDTQKTLFDVEAVASGRLAGVLVAAGDPLEPHQVIARIMLPGDVHVPVVASPEATGTVTQDDTPEAPRPSAATPSSRPPVDAQADPAPPRTGSSPRARRLAATLGVTLDEVSGTGPGGLVTEADVRGTHVLPDGPSPATPATSVSAPAGNAERLRRGTAELTTRSWQTVPHFFVRMDADLTSGLEVAKPTPLVVAAFARALRGRPEANLAWQPDGTLLQRPTVDLGILVDTPDGLLLPMIHQADGLGLRELADEIRSAADRARSGKLRTEDFGPRSGSVSNLGMFAVDAFAGVLAAPDVLLLSVGRVGVRPIRDGSTWTPRSVASLTLSVVHRALDGADAGRLLTDLERLLGDPSSIA